MKRIALIAAFSLISTACLAQDPWTGPKSAALSRLALQQCGAPELSSAMMLWAKINGFRADDTEHRLFVRDFITHASAAFRLDRAKACGKIEAHAAGVLNKFN